MLALPFHICLVLQVSALEPLIFSTFFLSEAFLDAQLLPSLSPSRTRRPGLLQMSIYSTTLTIVSLGGGISHQCCPLLCFLRVEEVHTEGSRPSRWRLQLVLVRSTDCIANRLQGPFKTDLKRGKVLGQWLLVIHRRSKEKEISRSSFYRPKPFLPVILPIPRESFKALTPFLQASEEK